MEFVDRILENPGRSIKKLARVLLVLGLVLAIILFVVGGIMFLSGVGELTSEYSSGYWSSDHNSFIEMLTCDYVFAEDMDVEFGYFGRIAVADAVWLAVASLAFIPLYGFGCVVEDTAAIKKEVCHCTE